MVEVRDLNDEKTTVQYDGFGRIVQMHRPSPAAPEATSSAASLQVQYFLPAVTGRPVSMLVSHTQDGQTDDDEEYHVTYAYIDGLGRTIATLSEADAVEDGYAWIVQGLTDYDAKGAERRKYLAWIYDGNPESYDLFAPAPTQYGQQRYDAFGRAVETWGLYGTRTKTCLGLTSSEESSACGEARRCSVRSERDARPSQPPKCQPRYLPVRLRRRVLPTWVAFGRAMAVDRERIRWAVT